MNSNYEEIPDNYDLIDGYLITDVEKCIDKFSEHDIRCFYDTCALQHHASISDKSLILKFLLERCGLIIITRTVLMELAGEEHTIKQTQVDYFKEIYDYGIEILLLNEEDIIYLLREAVDLTNRESNSLLGYSIKQIMKSCRAINNLMKQTPTDTKSKLLGFNPGDELLYESFFEYARQNKVSGDSLAEELMFICFIVLTRMPFGKYIFLSDDLASVDTVTDLINYIREVHGMDCPKMLTTVKIVEILLKENISDDDALLLDILGCSYSDRIPTLCIDEYDLRVTHKTFEKEDLIDKIKNRNFKVII